MDFISDGIFGGSRLQLLRLVDKMNNHKGGHILEEIQMQLGKERRFPSTIRVDNARGYFV